MRTLRLRSVLLAIACAAGLAASSAFASGDRQVTHRYVPPQAALLCPSLVGIGYGGACFGVTPQDKRVKQIEVVDQMGEPILGAWEISTTDPFPLDARYWFCGTWNGDIALPENANYVQVMVYSDLPEEYWAPLGLWDTEPTPSGCSTVGPTTGEITITFGS